MKSDPTSGKLTYKRKANTNDLVNFLKSNTSFDEDVINDAIYSVIMPDDADPSPNSNAVTTPQRQLPSYRGDSDNDAEDVEYRDSTNSVHSQNAALPQPIQPKAHGGKKPGVYSQTPDAIRKRAARSKRRQSINEDFIDRPTDLTEKDIEEIFVTLQASPASATSAKQDTTSSEPTQVNLDRIKSLIKTQMTAGQRKDLWRALNESELNESLVSRPAVAKILSNAANQRKHSVLNNKISIDELHQTWKDKGYPLDTRDIGDILQSYGFSKREIYNVFDTVLGVSDVDDNYDTPNDNNGPISPTVIKIANYIKANNLGADIVAFMKQSFSEELSDDTGLYGKAKDWLGKKFGRRATNEDVRRIFTSMLVEDCTMSNALARQHEYATLGRNKK